MDSLTSLYANNTTWWKRFFRYGLVYCALIVGMLVFWGFQYQREQRFRVEELLNLEVGRMHDANLDLLRMVDEARKDMEFLSSMGGLEDFLADSDQDGAMAALFRNLVEVNPAYLQMRLLDESGNELLRVNRKGNRVEQVEEADLQQKMHRDYFREAISCEAGQTYYSALDLNVEHGRIEVPYVPVMRVGHVVEGPRGKVLFLVNLAMGPMLERYGAHQWVFNSRGQVIHGDGAWDFYFKPVQTLKERDPFLWELFSRNLGEDGRFLESDLAFSVMGIEQGQYPRKWLVVSFLDEEIVDAIMQGYRNRVYLTLGATALVLLMGTLLVAYYASKARHARYRFQALFEQASDPHFLVNDSFHFVKCNQASLDILGAKRFSEVEGVNIIRFCPEQQSDGSNSEEKARSYLALTDLRGSYRFDWEVKNVAGELVPLEVSLTLVSKGNVSLYLGVCRNLSESKRAEAALQESEARYRILTENAPEAIVILDAERLKIIEVNRNTEVLLKEQRENILDFHPEEFFPLFQPDGTRTLRHIIRAIRRARRGENPVQELVIKDSFGERHSVEVRLVHFNAGGRKFIRVSVNDVTDRVKMQRMLARQANFLKEQASKSEQEWALLRAVMASTPDILFYTDLEGRLLGCNRAFEQFVGMSEREVVGKLGKELFRDEVGSKFDLNNRTTLNSQKTLENEQWVVMKDDRVLVHTLRTPVFNSENKVIGIIGLGRDITQRKRSEDQLMIAKQQAEEANRYKSEFLANMSHEIRTPMNAIVGMAHLMEKSDLDPKQNEYLRKVKSSARVLLGIIDDILDFSKIEAGRLEMEAVDFSLQEAFQNLSDMISLRAEEKGLELIFRVAPDVPELLKGDPLRLGQILINLASNAVKFTEKGEIYIGVEVAHDLSVEDPNEVTLRFSVEDTGIGMSQQQVINLFKAFSQADSSITRRYGGTGLGLAISKKLVQLMGGVIQVRSMEGEGSRFQFTVSFPVVKHAAEPTVAKDKRLRVMVIEENPKVLEVLQEYLEYAGMEVLHERNGRDAITNLGSLQESSPVDLVVVDWKLRGLDGIETTRLIKYDPDFQKMPVLLMVNTYGREETMRNARGARINGFISKPVGRQELLVAIEHAMKRRDLQGKGTATPTRAMRKEALCIAGAHILLVEDNKINQEVAIGILDHMGVKVEVANHGQEALDILHSGKQQFDAVLMDLQMPVLDGIETTKQLRSDKRFDHLPIIAMTAHALTKDREQCYEVGMNAHTAKPIDPANLLRELSKWVQPGREKQPVVSKVEKRSNTESILPNKVEGIDIQSAVAKVGGNQALILRLLKRFQDDFEDAARRIVSAFNSGNRDVAARLAHNVKGVSGNIGAKTLCEVSAKLEQSIEKANKQEFLQAVASFSHALEEVMDSIKLLRDAEKPSSEEDGKHESREVHREHIAPLIKSIAVLVNENSFEADIKVGELKSELAYTPLQQDAMQLEQQISDYDYDGARATLQRLAEVLEVQIA